MIDIENEIFSKCYDELTASPVIAERFPDIEIKSITDLTPRQFPSVSVSETDNYTRTAGQSSSADENFAYIAYEVNIFTKGETRKSDAKQILDIVDRFFIRRNFARTTRIEIATGDNTVYRLFARYIAVVSKNYMLYRR